MHIIYTFCAIFQYTGSVLILYASAVNYLGNCETNQKVGGKRFQID